MGSLIRMQYVDYSMSTNEFFINELRSLLASSGWHSSRFRPPSKVVYGRNDVFISLYGFRKWSNKVDSYSFPWCRSRDREKFVLFSSLSVNLTLMTRLHVFLDFLIHSWPVVLRSHFLHYLSSP